MRRARFCAYCRRQTTSSLQTRALGPEQPKLTSGNERSAQNNWSLFERQVERDLVPATLHYGVGVLPYYPLAEGMLTGKVRRGRSLPAGSRIADRSHLATVGKPTQSSA